MRNPRPLLLATIVFISVLFSGCSLFRDHGYAKPYKFENPKLCKHNYRSKAFRTNYDNFISRNELDQARMERNAILAELMYLVDAAHGEFERDGRLWKSVAELVGDLAILGVNGAGAVAGGAATKSILHVISGGIEGSQLALNKRLFQDQALEAIQSQMRAQMQGRKAEIINSMKQDVAAYPLEMGLSDIVNYYYDGTITRALQNLVHSAKTSEANADIEVKNAKENQ